MPSFAPNYTLFPEAVKPGQESIGHQSRFTVKGWLCMHSRVYVFPPVCLRTHTWMCFVPFRTHRMGFQVRDEVRDCSLGKHEEERHCPASHHGKGKGHSGTGRTLSAMGYTAKHPVVMIPGFITTGLEVWKGDECADWGLSSQKPTPPSPPLV